MPSRGHCAWEMDGWRLLESVISRWLKLLGKFQRLSHLGEERKGEASNQKPTAVFSTVEESLTNNAFVFGGKRYMVRSRPPSSLVNTSFLKFSCLGKVDWYRGGRNSGIFSWWQNRSWPMMDDDSCHTKITLFDLEGCAERNRNPLNRQGHNTHLGSGINYLSKRRPNNEK